MNKKVVVLEYAIIRRLLSEGRIIPHFLVYCLRDHKEESKKVRRCQSHNSKIYQLKGCLCVGDGRRERKR